MTCLSGFFNGPRIAQRRSRKDRRPEIDGGMAEMNFRKHGWVLVIASGSLLLAAMVAGRRRKREIERLQAIQTREDRLDEALEESFPASDPPALWKGAD